MIVIIFIPKSLLVKQTIIYKTKLFLILETQIELKNSQMDNFPSYF